MRKLPLVLAPLLLVPAAPASARPAPPDPSFGGKRGLVYPVPGDESAGHALAVLRSGRIVAAGSARRGAGESFALVRLSRRGRVERRRYVRFPEAPFAAATDVTVSRGRILVAGVARDGRGEARVALAALRPSMRPDPRFGAAGQALGPALDADVGVPAMAVDRAGRILVAGTAHAGGARIRVARFLPDGTLDSSFGVGGTFTSAMRAHARAIALGRRGEVYVAGAPARRGARRPNVLLMRLTRGGTLASLDVRRVGRGVAGTGPVAILRRRDGKLNVAADISDRSARSRPALLRYRRSGRLERGFGRRGVRRLGRRRANTDTVGIARRRDGRLVVAARGPRYATWSFYGLTRSGRPDPRARERVARNVGRHDGAQLQDFAVRGRRLLGVGRDDLDERIDYHSWFMLAAFRG